MGEETQRTGIVVALKANYFCVELLPKHLIESSNKEGLMDNLAKLLSDNVSNHRSRPSSS